MPEAKLGRLATCYKPIPRPGGSRSSMKPAAVKAIAEPYHMGDDQDFPIAMLADADGNYFQLVSLYQSQNRKPLGIGSGILS